MLQSVLLTVDLVSRALFSFNRVFVIIHSSASHSHFSELTLLASGQFANDLAFLWNAVIVS